MKEQYSYSIPMRNKIKCLLGLMIIPGFSAMGTTWIGAIDTDWTNGGNWDDGIPGDGVFNSPTANQPVLNADYTGSSYTFNSGGWTINANGNTLTPYNHFSSSGSGINILNGNLGFGGNSGTAHNLHIGAGNTLNLTGNFALGGIPSLSGSGNLVVGGSITGFDLASPFSLYANSSSTVGLGGLTFSSGSGLGGTANIAFNGYSIFTPGSGTFLSPGYDGTSPISTVTYTSGWASAGINLTGSSLVIDIGSTVGSNDQIVLGSGMTRSNGFVIGGADLMLKTPDDVSTILSGGYTLISESGGSYDGMFGDVYLNGELIDENDITLTYNPDSVVLNVLNNLSVGVVPEPGTWALIFGLSGLVFVMIRRRKISP